MTWGLVGLRLLLVAGVWGFRFCCAARQGGYALGDGGHAFELTNVGSVRG